MAPGVRAAFTGRRGGLSQPPYDSLNMGGGSGDHPDVVARNRALAAAACGLIPDRTVWMRQVHGADVARVAAPEQSQPLGGPRDASLTSVPGLALAVLSADCPGVLIADPDAGVVGAAHCGREGMARGVVPALVEAMTGAGADPAGMHAVIGPAICGRCYEVPAAMRDDVEAKVPGSASLTRAGTPAIDLHAGIATQLAGLGVRNVQRDGRCTAEDEDLYSYRRDGRTGRFAGLIWLTR
ncbi:MAG: peptidoglycan editing factor PgeF [Streptosporangiaceae bacterium]